MNETRYNLILWSLYTNFIIGMRPIYTANGEGLTEMMQFLEPRYCLPSALRVLAPFEARQMLLFLPLIQAKRKLQESKLLLRRLT